jgi:CRISPR-associated protein Cmr3
MTIRIEPLDTFFFRDGKPFTMGAETWTDTVFPPSPNVFYGALRTCWLSNQIGVFSKDNIDLSEKLKIKGIFIQIDDNLYLPVPRDFVEKKEKKKKEAEHLLTDKIESVISNKPTSVMSVERKDVRVEEIANNALFDINVIKQYLKKQNTDYYYYLNASDYLVKESKLGISRNFDTRTTEEGMLYRVDFNRFKNDENKQIAFVIDFEGLDNFPNNGIIKLGGEGKLARFDLITQKDIPAPTFQNCENFKIYLATPAIFQNGWLPKWINKTTLLSEHDDFKVKLISASIGKYISIGGFDILRGEPKPMNKAVPAGSVYHFQLLEGHIDKVIETLHGKCISDIESDCKQGFGLSYIGKI